MGASPAKLPLKFMLVVASDGFWQPDYKGVSQACEARNIALTIVSSDSYAYSLPKDSGQIKVDATIKHADASSVDAVIFAGGNVAEYRKGGRSFVQVQRLVQNAISHEPRVIVSSLCTGDEILIDQGVLDGLRVAKCASSDYSRSRSKLLHEAVVQDGYFFTAAHADHATELIDKIAAKVQSIR